MVPRMVVTNVRTYLFGLEGRNLEHRIPLSTKTFLPYPSIGSPKNIKTQQAFKRKLAVRTFLAQGGNWDQVQLPNHHH